MMSIPSGVGKAYRRVIPEHLLGRLFIKSMPLCNGIGFGKNDFTKIF